LSEQDKRLKNSLEILGVNEDVEVLLRYINQEQNINQTFGVRLKDYVPHQQSNFVDKDGNDNAEIFNDKNAMSKQDRVFHDYMRLASEGAYTFRPEIDDDRKSF